MSDCLFCKIIEKQIPATVVYEDDLALAFRDIHPQAPTHVLVIPKQHIYGIDAIQPEHETLIGHLFSVAAQIAAKEGLASSGYRAVMNSGPDAGQSVFHVHLHVLGGKAMGWPPFPRA